MPQPIITTVIELADQGSGNFSVYSTESWGRVLHGQTIKVPGFGRVKVTKVRLETFKGRVHQTLEFEGPNF